MSVEAELTLDEAFITAVERRMAGFDREANRIISAGLNQGLDEMRHLITEEVSAAIGIEKRVVRTRLWASRARASRLSARARVGRVGWPLHDIKHFGALPSRGQQRLLPASMKAEFPHTFVLDFWWGDPVARAVEHRGSGRWDIRYTRTDDASSIIRRLAAEPRILDAGRARAMEVIEYRVDKFLGSEAAP